MDDEPRTIRELAMYYRVASADLMAVAWQLGIQLESASTQLSDLELQQLKASDRFAVVTRSVSANARAPGTTASGSAPSNGSGDEAKSVGGVLLSALSGARGGGHSTSALKSGSPALQSTSGLKQRSQPESKPPHSRRAKRPNRPTATLDDARRYFQGSRYLQEQYQGGQLVGPHAVQHLSTALRISMERAQRYLRAIDEAIAVDLAAHSQRDPDRIVTPGFVAASGLASIAGFAIGLLSGYKGKYK